MLSPGKINFTGGDFACARIGGFVDFDRDARRGGPVLSAMDRRLRPRGPDASGTYTHPVRGARASAG